jgi:hypothetical protein
VWLWVVVVVVGDGWGGLAVIAPPGSMAPTAPRAIQRFYLFAHSLTYSLTRSMLRRKDSHRDASHRAAAVVAPRPAAVVNARADDEDHEDEEEEERPILPRRIDRLAIEIDEEEPPPVEKSGL